MKNAELIELCAREPWNRKAWLEFYNRFDKRIWLVIYRECKAMGISRQADQFKQTVEDLVQDVYVKLSDNNCKALKNFVGASENSIYTYLGIIAKNVVRNHAIKVKAQKRPSIEKSLDEVIAISETGEKILIRDTVRSPGSAAEQDFSVEILREEIEDILNKILTGKQLERDKLIFKLHLYQKFSAEDITKKFNFGLSSKRISNLITSIKKDLRQELSKRLMEA
jgi:RNA polymerase sigma factor (sigma-70 family)